MVRYISVTIFTMIILSFVACGGGDEKESKGSDGSSSQNSEQQHENNNSNIKYMSIDKPEELKEGDKIIRHQENTIVSIVTDIETGATTATLKEGNASIETR